MENIHKCVYCENWTKATVYRKSSIKRLCPIIRKKVSINSYSCKYFSPHHSFFCDNNNHWLGFIACLNRRRNPKYYKTYENCNKCRQFDPDIKNIITDYYINRIPILEPSKKKRILKRRRKTPLLKGLNIILKKTKNKKKRILKRRKKW